MAIKIALNGFGRIGRCLARIANYRDDIQIVAINDDSDREITKYLLENDSVHKRADFDVKIKSDDEMLVGEKSIRMLRQRDPKKLDFQDADILIECTGAFLRKESVQSHIDKGIKKVIFSAPAKDDTPTYVMGVNEDNYKGEDIISNASCTTNCLAPIAKILDDNLGIEKGLMTTIHSYTNDQNILDVKHKDKRRARAAAINMIPSSTGAAKALSLVIPKLKNKVHGQSVRVPTPNVSMVDLNVLVNKKTSKEELNELFIKASKTKPNIIGIDEEYRVSSDFIGDSRSSIVALDLSQVIEGDLLKVMAWYDNEWGYSHRLLDLALFTLKNS